MSGINVYGLRDARRLVRETKALMKGRSGEYVKGWRAALSQLDLLLSVNINHRLKEGRQTFGNDSNQQSPSEAKE